MLLACFQAGEDPFKQLASTWLNKPLGEVGARGRGPCCALLPPPCCRRLAAAALLQAGSAGV